MSKSVLEATCQSQHTSRLSVIILKKTEIWTFRPKWWTDWLTNIIVLEATQLEQLKPTTALYAQFHKTFLWAAPLNNNCITKRLADSTSVTQWTLTKRRIVLNPSVVFVHMLKLLLNHVFQKINCTIRAAIKTLCNRITIRSFWAETEER